MSYEPSPTTKRTYTTARVFFVFSRLGPSVVVIIIALSILGLKVPLWGQIALLVGIGFVLWRTGSDKFFSPDLPPESQYRLYLAFSNGDGLPRNVREAQKWLQKAADAGYAAAYTELAEQHLNDAARGDRYQRALPLLLRAAGQNDERALYHLGEMYRNGQGVTADEKLALSYLQRAADLGHPYHQNRLGCILAEGLGVTPDDEAAADWFKRAAMQDDPTGQENLAEVYLRGLGVAQDDVEALKWYLLAQSHGEGLTQESRGYLNGLTARLSPEQVGRAERQAKEWREANRLSTESANAEIEGASAGGLRPNQVHSRHTTHP